MMRMRKPNDRQMKIMERLVRPWLEKMKFSPQVFWDLQAYEREQLYKWVCVGGEHPSDAQLRNLYRSLRSASTEGRIEGHYSDPIDHPTNEQLMAFFSQDTSPEQLAHLRKF
ncbi:MAG: hypothetical protein WBC82_11515 [Dehalococcoidia bacterium]